MTRRETAAPRLAVASLKNTGVSFKKKIFHPVASSVMSAHVEDMTLVLRPAISVMVYQAATH
jgi:hypothetical protein